MKATPRIVGQLLDPDNIADAFGADIVEIYCPVCDSDNAHKISGLHEWECNRCGTKFTQDYKEDK